MTVKYQHIPYQGTIGKWNMKYQKPYQGNISPSKLKYTPPYQGSLKREDFRPKVYGKLADRNSSYRYYQLPPDYYDIRTRNRGRPLSPVEASNGRQLRDNVQPKTLNPSPQNEGHKPAPKYSATTNVDRHAADRTRLETPTPQKKQIDKQVKEQARPPVTAAAAAATTKPPRKNKPQASTRKPPDPVSPFPPASPEPHKPGHRRDIKITPEPIRVGSFAGVTKPEPVFPPIMPLSMEDYVRTEHARKIMSPRTRRNPLVPIFRPADESATANLLRYSRFSPNLSVPRDSYDSLSRSFTNVPGYNAVGSVLRSLNMYNH